MRLFLFKKIRFNIKENIDSNEDILMCHSDFFPNTIPTWLLSKYFNKKAFCWFHMQAPSVFRGFLGQFTGKFTWPNLSRVHYILNQQLFFALVKRINGFVLAVNPYYNDFLSKKKIEYYIIEKFGGADIELDSVRSQNLDKKEFDLIFLGRFHEQKGILEIPDILEIVVRSVPQVKMAIVGSGHVGIEKKLNAILKDKNLVKNVKMFGSLVGSDKVAVLNQSKIFIFPSYFESFGIVVLEAMDRGLPVIAYNLPVYGVFRSGMIKVPVLDNVSFAGAIVNLLNNDSEYKNMSVCAQSFASSFSWEKTSAEVFSLIKKF